MKDAIDILMEEETAYTSGEDSGVRTQLTCVLTCNFLTMKSWLHSFVVSMVSSTPGLIRPMVKISELMAVKVPYKWVDGCEPWESMVPKLHVKVPWMLQWSHRGAVAYFKVS